MKSPPLMFFATPADIGPVLARFEANTPLKFVQMGERADADRPVLLAADEIPEPGLATHETASISRTYLVTLRDTMCHQHVRTLPDGQRRWNLFPVDNQEGITLSLGGLWKTGTLLPGILNVMNQNEVAKGLRTAFRKALQAEDFVKVRQFYVGPESFERLRSGKRLSTTAEQSPPAFDLVLP